MVNSRDASHHIHIHIHILKPPTFDILDGQSFKVFSVVFGARKVVHSLYEDVSMYKCRIVNFLAKPLAFHSKIDLK